MTDEELTDKLIDRVERKDYTVFHLIESKYNYADVKAAAKACREVAKSFRRTAECLFSDYVESVRAGGHSAEKLVLRQQLIECFEFYDREAATLTDMMAEYRCYVRCGHRLQSLLGYGRDEADMTDYRALDWRL